MAEKQLVTGRPTNSKRNRDTKTSRDRNRDRKTVRQTDRWVDRTSGNRDTETRRPTNSSSNWILMSCQPHRVTSGQSNSGHKQIHISKLSLIHI